eukprot:SAG31_NODE_1318_length_8823_cov_3.108780_3_plen_237_part_00
MGLFALNLPHTHREIDCYFLDFHGTFRAESPTYAPRNPGLIEKVPACSRCRVDENVRGGGLRSAMAAGADGPPARVRCPGLEFGTPPPLWFLMVPVSRFCNSGTAQRLLLWDGVLPASAARSARGKSRRPSGWRCAAVHGGAGQGGRGELLGLHRRGFLPAADAPHRRYLIPLLHSSIAFLYCIPLLHSSIAFLYCTASAVRRCPFVVAFVRPRNSLTSDFAAAQGVCPSLRCLAT